MRLDASNEAGGRQQQLGLVIATSAGGGCCELASMAGRHVSADVVAAGPRPAPCEVVSLSSQHSDRGHDVSILMATVDDDGWWRGWQLRAKVSMMIMRLPQHGQGWERVGGSLGSVASASAGWS